MNEPHLQHLHLDHAALLSAGPLPDRNFDDELAVWPLHVAMPFIVAVSLGLWALIWLCVIHGAGLAVALVHAL